MLGLIHQRRRFDESGAFLEGATAYEHAVWLAAIKDYGEKENGLYKAAVEIAKADTEHPDFASYISVGWAEPKSPYSVDELNALPIKELTAKLVGFKGSGRFREPDTEGLAKTLKQVVKSAPIKYYSELLAFSELDLAYIHAIVDAYSELWAEKISLPWDDIWPNLLRFCSVVVQQARFWSEEGSRQLPTTLRKQFGKCWQVWLLAERGDGAQHARR